MNKTKTKKNKRRCNYEKTTHTLDVCHEKKLEDFSKDYNGLSKLAPFDKILITAAASEIPKFLFSQLKIGGKLVVPVGDSVDQEMLLIEKISDKKMHITKHGLFSFVPMLKNKN